MKTICFIHLFTFTIVSTKYGDQTKTALPWMMSAEVAHSFLKSRYKRSDPRCDNDEHFCESNKMTCMQHNENSRELRCSPNSCSATQTCFLAVPCPAHYQTGCTDDQCSSFPCHNGATCHDLVGNYKCQCVPGYDENTDCKTEKNECQSVPCQNGGSCSDLFNDFSCHCKQRYNGTTCEKDCRPGRADIIFVADTSMSLQNDTNRTIDVITQLINRLPFGGDDFLFALITFDFEPKVVFDFNDYSTKLDILSAVQTIQGKEAATYTKPALEKAVELARNPSSGSRQQKAHQFIILLYDGLSTDRQDAEGYAIAINQQPWQNRPIQSVFTVGIGESIDHTEMIMISDKSENTFSPLHLDDLYSRILKETSHRDCTDCSVRTETDMIILLDTNYNQTSDVYRERQEAIKRVIEKVRRFNNNVQIGMYSYTDRIQLEFSLSWSNNTDKLLAAALQVDRQTGSMSSNTSLAIDYINQYGFSISNGGRATSRKIVVVVSDGHWTDTNEINLKIKLSKQANIEVLAVIAGDDSFLDNYNEVLLDPSQMYYVVDKDYTSLESMARITSYYVCDPDIFTKRQ